MTKEELKQYRRPLPLIMSKLLVGFVEDRVEDGYGVYETGFFEYKGKIIFINKEDDRWYLSISASHPLGYDELKEIRYKFMPNDMSVAQIFPPREEFVNIHENCFHLWELDEAI